MKAFRKWREEFFKNHRGEMRYQPGDREGWKAALRWINKEAKKLEKQPESPIDVFDLIEEELQE